MLTRAEVEAALDSTAHIDPYLALRLARDWLAMEAVVARLPKTADAMNDLRTLLAPLDREAARTGVGYGRPEWLKPHEHPGLWEHVDADGTSYLPTDAARMIVEASIARTLSEHGMVIWKSTSWDVAYYSKEAHQMVVEHLFSPGEGDYLTALRDAMLRVYAALPDAAKGGE